jgi:hypothetical protein
VVAAGLLSAAAMFVWTSNADSATSYLEIAAQMILLGTGMGLTASPATEAIMGAVPDANAGVGSGVNDTTRELGGTLGVAVIGSVFASLYSSGLDSVPPGVPAAAGDSIGAALSIADGIGGTAGSALRDLATAGFYDGLQAGCLVAAAVCVLGAVVVLALLPAQPAPVEAGGDDLGDGDVEAAAGEPPALTQPA